MKIEHLALWVSNLELIREFYVKYFGAISNEKYHNERTGFTSYFLSFGTPPRLEIMNRHDISGQSSDLTFGYAHIAFSVGSKEKVLELTERLRSDGYQILGEPRTTGDGYFESVCKDPEGTLIEITI